MEKHSKVATIIKDYLVITIGLFIYTMGWTVFITPNHLVGGGVSGISAVIQYVTGFPMSYSYFIINVFLLVLALKVLGSSFGVKTVVAICLASVFLRVEPMFVPEDFIQDVSIENGKLVCALLGGAMAGLGIGITFSRGGSTGGTDIIALIINKYRHIPPGKVILLCDVFIVASSLLVTDNPGESFSLGHRIANVVFGYILVACTSSCLDLYLNGMKQSQQFFIFSKKYEEIAKHISEDVRRGVTLLDSEGWYSKQKGKILMVICRKNEMNQIFRLIREIDSEAFVSVTAVSGVYGQGFDVMRVKSSFKKI